MIVAFRTDASLDIGTGHVMRCLALAGALRESGSSCMFISRALPGHLADRIANEGFDVTLLPSPESSAPTGPPSHAAWAGVGWAQDATETRAEFREKPDWLVVDHYAFDARWQQGARSEGTRLMVIDDLADRPHSCDLLLDQNFAHFSDHYDGLLPEAAIRLIGPQYALLRPEFAAARAGTLTARARRRGLKRLMISMGGVDVVDATSAILEALRAAPLPADLEISVVMGGRAPALDKVREIARGMPRQTEVVVDVDDMAARMATADLAIGGGGTTTLERCCLGLPSIVVETAANQAGMAEAIASAGAGLASAPLYDPVFAHGIRDAMVKATCPAHLATMSEAAAEICDGNGSTRVIEQMNRCKESEVQVL
ncbi:UDP-2,4-diacetamido-2,4,6-trideoxy-beta-L-altropyranose hydrolase [Sulfitobacter sp. 1A16808]|uniref:UDP-2,4-diacetamido-2,4, 6-trideoxy-beta-L-altropyranose hydrolase n=1 Tax=Sulfitobacter sp. 1A16808 TaxID=3368572 RepID=UPI00374612D2